MASAIHNAFRQVGQVLGVAVLGALVYAHLPSGPGAGRPLSRLQGDAFVGGLHNAIWVAGLALLATTLFAALIFSKELIARAGRQDCPPGARPPGGSAAVR
jgi:DHA2 family methylenomycin A resistance protein-like MFS transporter